MASVVLTPYPRLRSLDIRPYSHNGHAHILLRDTCQISDQTLLVPQPLAAALAFCDGKHDLPAICRAYEAQYGHALPLAWLKQLLTTLDEALMLDNERSEQQRIQTLAAYQQAAFRPPALTGLGYPAEPRALARLLQSYLDGVDDEPPRLTGSTRGDLEGRGLLSPHIDYARGGSVYAQVWKRAAPLVQQADLVVLIGTDHYGTDPFTLTRQNYATPYGILPTAQDVVNALVDTIGEDAAFAGELRHRGEHSLELVATWLHHMRGGEPCALVPILVGGFHRFIQKGTAPATDPLLGGVMAALHSSAANRRVLFVASGDLAHVGPAFGGEALDAAGRVRLRAADDALIEQMCDGSAEGFFAAIRQVRDENNVCGVAPIYLTMRLAEPSGGHCLGYATCPADEHDTSVVTVAGVLFD